MIFIYNLSDDLTTIVKLFADGTSFFSVADNMNTSNISLRNDINKIRNWKIQWKMNFNPDPSEQAQEAIFSRKLQKTKNDPVYFDHNSVQQVLSKKHL